jgi:hypothetical protein
LRRIIASQNLLRVNRLFMVNRASDFEAPPGFGRQPFVSRQLV